MIEYTFSRFIYFDTNIISTLAKDRSLWPKLSHFLSSNNLTIGLSSAQVAELSDAFHLHKDLVSLLISHPTGVLKLWDTIISEEVKSYPKERTQTLLMYALNAILLEDSGIEKLLAFFSSPKLREARSDQIEHAKLMESRLIALKDNFSPSTGGKYIRSQADDFVNFMVIQWLSNDHIKFLQRIQRDIPNLNLEVFYSIRLYAYVVFYKYYLGQRRPKRLSDFGDFGHLFYLHYCYVAVMERDLCNVLSQIKKNHSILGDTILTNIELLQDWKI